MDRLLWWCQEAGGGLANTSRGEAAEMLRGTWHNYPLECGFYNGKNCEI